MKNFIIRLLLVCVVFTGHSTHTTVIADIQKKLEKTYKETKEIRFSDIPYIGDIPVPKPVKSVLNNIKITDVGFTSGVATTDEGYNSGFIMTGDAELYGAKVGAAVEFIAPVNISAPVTGGSVLPKGPLCRFTLQLPIGWKLSDTIPELKSLETLEFERVAFNISNFSVAVENRIKDFGIKKLPEGVEIKAPAGFSVVGGARPAGFLKPVANFLNYHKEFYLVGSFSLDDSADVSFQGIIPLAIELIKGLKMTAIQLVLSSEPSVELKTAALLAVPYEKEDLVFITSVKIEKVDTQLFGALDGVWKKPFGVIPITVEDVGLSIAFMGGAMSGGGVRGKFIFNEEKEKWIEIALQGKLSDGLDLASPDAVTEGGEGDVGQADEGGSVAADGGGVVLYGAFKGGVYLEDVLDIYLTMAKESGAAPAGFKNKVMSAIPNIGFEEAKIYFVPKSTEIGDMNFEKGTRFMAKANILGLKPVIDIKFTPNGFRGLGYLPELKLGPLLITGTGADFKEDTKDDGAVIFIKVDTGHIPRMHANSIINLDIFGGIKREVDINFYKSGINFTTTTDLAGLYETTLDIAVSAKNLSSIYVEGSMEQSALKKFDKLIKNACNDMINKANKDLNDAQKKTTDWWDNGINDLENKMKAEKEAAVNALRKEEQRLRDLADNYEKKLKALEEYLKNQSKKKFEKAKNAAKKCKKGNVLKCGKAGYYYTLGGGSWTASKAVKEIRKNKEWKALNKAFLNASAEVVRAAKQISKIIGDAYSIHNAVAYGFAQSMKYASVGAIEVAGWGAQAVAEAGKIFGTLGANVVNIKEISFAGDAKEFKSKKLPKVKVRGKVMGIDISMSLQLDLDNVDKFVETIAKKAIDQVAGPFKSKKDKPKKPDLSKDDLAQAMKQAGKNPEEILIPYDNIIMISAVDEKIELKPEKNETKKGSNKKALRQAIQNILGDKKNKKNKKNKKKLL